MNNGESGTPVQSPALRRIVDEDAVGQLVRRDGRMAELGTEGGTPKLDWVEGVARLLDGDGPERVEAEARAIRESGIRHVIWAGMGGSVLTIRVLAAMGFCGEGAGVSLYPLDSTDPAALDDVARRIAQAKGLRLASLPPAVEHAESTQGETGSAGFQPAGEGRQKVSPGTVKPGANGAGVSPALPAEAARDVTTGDSHALLDDVMMVGVAMGMTSEEPITHLQWFTDLLQQAGLPPEKHLLVMTLPDSYLDRFAREHGAPSRPLQLDGGTGTPGRMSAPATRVFLLPVALHFSGDRDASGALRAVLQQAQDWHDLALARRDPAAHPFVRLAAAASDASRDGACRLLLSVPSGWDPLVAWLEQLLEESLGKGGKGIVVFPEQRLNAAAPGFHADGTLHVTTWERGPLAPRFASDWSPRSADLAAQPGPSVEPGEGSLSAESGAHANPYSASSEAKTQDKPGTGGTPALPAEFLLRQPYLAAIEPRERLSALAASFLGWQLTTALYGELHGITFVGQPAVEDYKARARALRERDDPLLVALEAGTVVTGGPLMLVAPPAAPIEATPAATFAAALRGSTPARDAQRLDYVDLTINGATPDVSADPDRYGLLGIGNDTLGVPVKARTAPASYHSTEQSEMDGPPGLVSLRVVARTHQPASLGAYDDRFLQAQAVGTWQAMVEAGRACYLLIVDAPTESIAVLLDRFFRDVREQLNA